MRILDIGETTARALTEQATDLALKKYTFTSASDIEPPVDFTTVDVPKTVYGWERVTQTHNYIGWETPAGYWLLIEHPNRIRGYLPDENHEDPHAISTQRVLRTRMDTLENAVDWASDWMIKRGLDPDSNLSEYTGIGRKLQEHLQIVYGVNYGTELYQFFLEDEHRVQAIVGTQHCDQLITELQSEFEYL